MGVARREPQFAIRGLRLVAEDRGVTTEFTYKATIVALGDAESTAEPYLVMYGAQILTGCDPDLRRDREAGFVAVEHGTAEISVTCGWRTKPNPAIGVESERWEPGKVEVELLGATRLHTLTETRQQL